MTNVKEFKEWLSTLDDANSVAVEDGGLTIVELTPEGKETGAYFELGGVEGEGDENPFHPESLEGRAWEAARC